MDDRAIIRSFESGFNKRVIAVIVLAIVVVLALVVFVVRGFHGHDISRGAAAMTNVSQPVKTTNPAPAPARTP